LNETYQRLLDELHVYTAFICALRCADLDTSVRMLDHLQHGDYDGALSRNDPGSEMTPPADRAYPFDRFVPICSHQLGLAYRYIMAAEYTIHSSVQPGSLLVPTHNIMAYMHLLHFVIVAARPGCVTCQPPTYKKCRNQALMCPFPRGITMRCDLWRIMSTPAAEATIDITNGPVGVLKLHG
jgi:hypothetical protein